MRNHLPALTSCRRRLLLVSSATLLIYCIGHAIPKAPHATSGLSNAIVLVIRHGEKPSEGTGLTPAGQARAKAYVKYFHDYKVDGEPLHIDHIFATEDSKSSARERLTVAPLAKALKLTIDNQFKNKAYDKLADDIRDHHYGHELLICWHHGNIPNLVNALGADAASLIPGGKWPDDHFDWVVELHYDADAHVIPGSSKLVHEHLMPGDSN
jgi:hypothetical protein